MHRQGRRKECKCCKVHCYTSGCLAWMTCYSAPVKLILVRKVCDLLDTKRITAVTFSQLITLVTDPNFVTYLRLPYTHLILSAATYYGLISETPRLCCSSCCTDKCSVDAGPNRWQHPSPYDQKPAAPGSRSEYHYSQRAIGHSWTWAVSGT